MALKNIVLAVITLATVSQADDVYVLKGDAVQAGNKLYQWYGSSPLCNGACPDGTTEITKATKSPPFIANLPGLAAVLPFGDTCWSGIKVLCVAETHDVGTGNSAISDNFDCEWFGTAPACDGECPKGTVKQLRAKDDPQAVLGSNAKWGPFGSRCWTGKKALCCKKEATQVKSATNSSVPAPSSG